MAVRKREAWVTLVTNADYAKGAMVLGQSLRDVGTTKETVVMVTNEVPDNVREDLGTVYTHVVSVELLDTKDAARLRLLGRPELGITLSKINAWKLTDFAKAVFLDADCILMQNCDELFEREELSAVADCGWPDCFNSGVFVFRPSLSTLERLIQLAETEGTFDGGDQGLLNSYWSDWQSSDSSRHLSFLYNLNANVSYTYMPAFEKFGKNAKIVHFLGSWKPWRLMRFSNGDVYMPENCAHNAQFLKHWWHTYDRFQAAKAPKVMAQKIITLAPCDVITPTSPEAPILTQPNNMPQPTQIDQQDIEGKCVISKAPLAPSNQEREMTEPAAHTEVVITNLNASLAPIECLEITEPFNNIPLEKVVKTVDLPMINQENHAISVEPMQSDQLLMTSTPFNQETRDIGVGIIPFDQLPVTPAPVNLSPISPYGMVDYTFDNNAAWRQPEYKEWNVCKDKDNTDNDNNAHVLVHTERNIEILGSATKDFQVSESIHPTTTTYVPVCELETNMNTTNGDNVEREGFPVDETEDQQECNKEIGQESSDKAVEVNNHDSHSESVSSRSQSHILPPQKAHVMDNFWKSSPPVSLQYNDEEHKERGESNTWNAPHEKQDSSFSVAPLVVSNTPGQSGTVATDPVISNVSLPEPNGDHIPAPLPILAPYQGLPYNSGQLPENYVEIEWKKKHGIPLVPNKEDDDSNFKIESSSNNEPLPAFPSMPRWSFNHVLNKLNEFIPERSLLPAPQHVAMSQIPSNNLVTQTNKLIREVDTGLWSLSRNFMNKKPSEAEEKYLHDIIVYLELARSCIDEIGRIQLEKKIEEEKAKKKIEEENRRKQIEEEHIKKKIEEENTRKQIEKENIRKQIEEDNTRKQIEKENIKLQKALIDVRALLAKDPTNGGGVVEESVEEDKEGKTRDIMIGMAREEKVLGKQEEEDKDLVVANEKQAEIDEKSNSILTKQEEKCSSVNGEIIEGESTTNGDTDEFDRKIPVGNKREMEGVNGHSLEEGNSVIKMSTDEVVTSKANNNNHKAKARKPKTKKKNRWQTW